MTQTPQTPAGWYPANGVERWWDGNAWSEHTRPIGGVPVAPQMPQAYAPLPVAPKSNLARNLLIVFGVLFLVFVGGCVALVAVVGNKVDNVVNDDTEGGPNHPLTIVAGESFEVAGFEYDDDWTIGPDATGLVDVQGLKVHNGRDKTDQAFVTISLLAGDEVVAETTCTSDGRIAEDLTVTLTCSSGDMMPTDYDRITIKDVI